MRLLGFCRQAHITLNYLSCIPIELQCFFGLLKFTCKPLCSAQLSVLPPLATSPGAASVFTGQEESPGPSHFAHLHLL